MTAINVSILNALPKPVPFLLGFFGVLGVDFDGSGNATASSDDVLLDAIDGLFFFFLEVAIFDELDGFRF